MSTYKTQEMYLSLVYPIVGKFQTFKLWPSHISNFALNDTVPGSYRLPLNPFWFVCFFSCDDFPLQYTTKIY